MENPFELLHTRLDRIEAMLQTLSRNRLVADIKKTPDFMTIDQTATFLGKTRSTLYKYTSSRLIPHFKKGNQKKSNII